MDPLGEPPHITATTFLRVISLSIAFYESVANHLFSAAYVLTLTSPICTQLRPHPPRRMEILQEPALLETQPRLHSLHRHPVRPLFSLHTHALPSYTPRRLASYSSVAVLLLSNIGYFGHFFTPEACRRYYMAPPVFKGATCFVLLRLPDAHTRSRPDMKKPVPRGREKAASVA